MSKTLIIWRDEHAGEQFDAEFGANWASVLRELHATRQCDCCAPTAFSPLGAKAWIGEDGQLVLGKNWEDEGPEPPYAGYESEAELRRMAEVRALRAKGQA